MRIAHTIAGAPIGLDAAPTAVEPHPSRIFTVPLRDGYRNGLPFSLLSLLTDGTSLGFSVWIRVTTLVGVWYQIDATQLAFPGTVNTVYGLPPEADVFIQVVAVGGAPTQILFALVEQGRGVPGDSPKDLVGGGIVQLNPDNPNMHVEGLGLDYFPNETGGVNGTQVTNNDRPALLVGGGANGHNGVEFDAANAEHMDLVGLTDASNDYTVFAVLDESSIAATQQLLAASNATLFTPNFGFNGSVAAHDGTAYRPLMVAQTGEQILSWRLDSAGTAMEAYRDGVLLGVGIYDGTWAWANPTLGSLAAGANPLDGILSYLFVVNRALNAIEMAIVHAWLSDRFAIEFTPLSVANCGAWFDLDHATVAGGILTALTDRALGQVINIVGAPAVVEIDGQRFVRCDGVGVVLWIADAAALDGANGNTHILKHANTEALPSGGVHFAQKGRSAVHWNGGLHGGLSAGTRFDAYGNAGGVADIGPLAEFTSPAETIAMAFESGVAVRRIDGDGTYASNATAALTAVGVGSLTWGGADNGAGPVFALFSEIDLRFGAYYNRPINQYELEAVRNFGEAA